MRHPAAVPQETQCQLQSVVTATIAKCATGKHAFCSVSVETEGSSSKVVVFAWLVQGTDGLRKAAAATVLPERTAWGSVSTRRVSSCYARAFTSWQP